MGNSEHVIMVATFFGHHGQWTDFRRHEQNQGRGQTSDAVDRHQALWTDIRRRGQTSDAVDRHQALWTDIRHCGQTSGAVDRHQTPWTDIRHCGQTSGAVDRFQEQWAEVNYAQLFSTVARDCNSVLGWWGSVLQRYVQWSRNTERSRLFLTLPLPYDENKHVLCLCAVWVGVLSCLVVVCFWVGGDCDNEYTNPTQYECYLAQLLPALGVILYELKSSAIQKR